MWKKQIIAAVIISVIGASIANADLILTVDGQNPSGIPLMLQGIGPYQIALDGNTVIEPNDVRLEAVGGALTVISDVNHQYSFQYESGSTAGLIWLISNTEMTIDDINVPIDTTIYEIFVFCNPDVNLTGACGSDLSFLLPQEEEEGGEGDSMTEEPIEQAGTGEVMPTEETRESKNAIADYDPSWDLNDDGKINFNDFATLASGWVTTYDFYDLSSFCAAFTTIDCCREDVNASGPWQTVTFTGIGGCELDSCWDGQYDSDPCNDMCGHSVIKSCQETPEFDFYCAFNYWFAGRRVGLCVYYCGRNTFQIKKNSTGCRILQTRHRTRDIPPQDPECPCSPYCDEGTQNKYDWQITNYNDVNGVRTLFCRQSSLNPATENYWESYQGESSSCEINW